MKNRIGIVAATFLLAGVFACSPPEPLPEPSAAEPEEAPPPASPDQEIAQIRSRLEAVKGQLFDEEKYNCCVKPSCDWCALHEGSCDCFPNLQAGEAVCPGCGLGWHNGQGIVEGVDAKDVKWNITHEHASGGHAH
jgi:hypothetical protein